MTRIQNSQGDYALEGYAHKLMLTKNLTSSLASDAALRRLALSSIPSVSSPLESARRNPSGSQSFDFISQQLSDIQPVTTNRLAKVRATAGSTNFVENYPSAQGLKFSETKSATYLAYEGHKDETYNFPDGKTWKVSDVHEDNDTGFRAVVLQPVDEADQRVIIAYAGTTITSLDDWINVFGQAVGNVPPQFQQAIDLALKYKQMSGKHLILTGQSLGGALASHASIISNAPATTINANPLNTGAFPKDLRNNPEIKTRITNYLVPRDITNQLIIRDSVRPENEILIPGAVADKPIERFYQLGNAVHNFVNSIGNHILNNYATDVPPPVKADGAVKS